MIDHIWTVACAHAVIDQTTNILSLQDVLEQVTIQSAPRPNGVLSITMNVVTLWARADSATVCRGTTRMTFCSPSGTVFSSPEVKIDLSNSARHRHIWTVHGLHVSEAGTHTFRIELQNEGETEWHQVAAIPLEIIFAPQPTAQPLAQSQ